MLIETPTTTTQTTLQPEFQDDPFAHLNPLDDDFEEKAREVIRKLAEMQEKS